MWKKIDEKKARVDSFRPLPSHTLKSLQDQINLAWTYNSNAIEGNTLTLKETKVVLEGVTIGGKNIKEHLEALNHQEAINHLNQLIQNKESVTEKQIKHIHSLILKKIDPTNAGVYRKENVVIVGAKHFPPKHTQIPDEMKTLIQNYKDRWKTLHPAERSALLHIDLVKIHPFTDGNGRTARLMQNFELMKEGFLPLIIKKEQRLVYYKALDKAHTTGQTEDFMKLCSECLNEILDLYLKVLK